LSSQEAAPLSSGFNPLSAGAGVATCATVFYIVGHVSCCAGSLHTVKMEQKVNSTAEIHSFRHIEHAPFTLTFLCKFVLILIFFIELAKGGCMSEFRWNSGGSLHNKDWEEHLPTDAAVSMCCS
jgi:hypothetical protein